jgi:hypothetical protein
MEPRALEDRVINESSDKCHKCYKGDVPGASRTCDHWRWNLTKGKRERLLLMQDNGKGWGEVYLEGLKVEEGISNSPLCAGV